MATKRKLEDENQPLLPVTLLAGFLGSGKSTLLKHILESKKLDSMDGADDFRCAVIVNDMAELNIDGDLIESTGLVQSEEVVTMQNGCVCCNLSGELVDQMTNLAKQRKPYKFDYMIIEASGVSEPAAIAALFQACEEDHDHSSHEKVDEVALSDVAKLDTLVTVVDSAQFFQNIGLTEETESSIQTPKLLMDQVEYSNVVLLNKTDLVNEDQLNQVHEHVKALNGKAKVISCKESAVDVMEVVNTGLFKAEDFNLENFSKMFEGDKPKSCCKTAIAKGESPCCLRARTIDSGLSKVLLPSKKNAKTRHNENYQITSFVYKARRPLDPMKFQGEFIDPYFVIVEEEDSDEEEEEEDEEGNGETGGGDNSTKNAKLEVDKHKELEDIKKQMQEEGAKKSALRSDSFGTLLRMKGFLWQASSHDLIGFVSVAGDVARLESPGTWKCLDANAYTGTDAEKARLRKDWDGDWGDRRQELVFIGQGLKHEEIQKLLDSCLLSDDEMAMGVDGWKASFGDIFLNSA